MDSEHYEKPQASFVEFGEGDMGRYVTTSITTGDGETSDTRDHEVL